MEQRSGTQPLGARDERYFFAAAFLVIAIGIYGLAVLGLRSSAQRLAS